MSQPTELGSRNTINSFAGLFVANRKQDSIIDQFVAVGFSSLCLPVCIHRPDQSDPVTEEKTTTTTHH